MYYLKRLRLVIFFLLFLSYLCKHVPIEAHLTFACCRIHLETQIRIADDSYVEQLFKYLSISALLTD